MNAWSCKSNVEPPMETLNPLLPHVASVIENMVEASFPDIRRQIETDLGKKISSSDLTKALDDGIKLGVFQLKRKFKVCREFTTKEFKKVKQLEDRVVVMKDIDISRTSLNVKQKKILMDYVKRQREERKRRLLNKKGAKKFMLNKDFRSDNELYKFLCQRCRKCLEQERLEEFRNSRNSIQNSRSGNNTSRGYLESSGTSLGTAASERSPERRGEEKRKKSRLLVEKNPMETEPPYYDIFT